ncbi:MAG: bifunctional folylpolyglutamate synthase/dihydrofolate synthase [Proteobacteria bacterium]|nr:bifunctional folylpolyglutamate synthase/dihydrofolate synthase [Pseudomonadota bacterium]
MKEYSVVLEYLYNLEKFGIVFGLENIQWILNLIGNPHNALKSIHVGGTNGKGSVASMLSNILKETGYRVGKYTSPHLVSFTERITINEEEIKEKEVVELTAFIREKAEAKDKNRFFTFFDFTTVLAFEYFYRKEVDIAIIEVGLGGRLDSTNVIRPLLSIITNVDFDHMDYLGNSIEDIANEKAGIIKEGVPVITGATGMPVHVIEEKAQVCKSPVYLLGRDFSYTKMGDQIMSYHGLSKDLGNVFVNLKGDHQLSNGAIALCAIEYLQSSGFPVNEKPIYDAMSHIQWQGRLEIVREKPTIILDGAHNPDGAHALSEFIQTHYMDKRKILVFGVMKDKEYERMLKALIPVVDVIILTKPDIERAFSPSSMQVYAKDAIVTDNVHNALQKAKNISGDEDLIVVTGSFYTIGEAKILINEIF